MRRRGVWIFRGQGIPPIMLDECYDLELYNWTKVDIADAVRPLACPGACVLLHVYAALLVHYKVAMQVTGIGKEEK